MYFVICIFLFNGTASKNQNNAKKVYRIVIHVQHNNTMSLNILL